MNFKVFVDTFTKRWSTAFLALIAITTIFFAIYGAICILISELFPLQKVSIMHLTNPLEIIVGYTIALSPITSLIAYLFSIPSIVILKTSSKKLRWAMLSLIIILTLIICKLSFPYITLGHGQTAIYFTIMFVLGSPILVLDFIIYFIIFYMENTREIRILENNIAQNKYYKITVLSSIILLCLFFTPFIFPLLIRIFEKTFALIH